MVYNYYMKINFKKLSVLCLLAAFSVCASAQITVVKQDGDKLYLDTSSVNRSVNKGDVFKLITSKEKLINPKTGKNLGFIYNYSPEGQITEVQPLYAVGELKDAPQDAAGSEAVIEASAVPNPPAEPAQTAKAQSDKKIFRYNPVKQIIISVTEADVNADGADELVTLSDKGAVTVWDKTAETLKPLYTYQLTGKTPVTVSAKDVKETGRAQIFVTGYNARREAVTASVLELKGSALEETDSLPYFVKELGCGKDKEIWAQKPFVVNADPGSAWELEFEKGRFKTDSDRLQTQRNWLTGLNVYDVEKDGSDNLIYTSSNGRIRMVLQNGKRAESKDLFASTPNRVKYKQDILKFYPSVQVYGPEGKATIAAVENISKLGLLSDTFGSYQSGKIHFLNFEKGRLSVKDTVELDGYVYDTACTPRGILTAEVLPDGTSVVAEIFR